MSVNGFKVNGNTVRYDYRYLDNLPDLEGATAEDYNSTKTYNIGDYVWYNGVLYRCISDITTAEAWTVSHWTAAVLGDDVGELKSAVRNYALHPSENVPGQTIYSTYSIGGDGWTGYMNACFRYGDPVYGGIKNLKVAAKFENSTIYLLVMKEENGRYIIEKTYSKSSGSSGYVEFNNIQFEGFKYIAIRGPFVTRTDIGVHNGYIGTSTVNVGDNTDSLAKNTTYGIIWNFVILSQPAIGIDPDSFTGTDSEKLQKAFDYLQFTGGSICIRRQFTIGSTIIIRHLYEKNNRIVVYGVSKNSIIKVNALYGFKGLNGSTGGVIFRDLIITGTSNVSHSVLTGGNTENGEELISIIFENCYINSFPVIFNATNYVQHISFHNCIIRDISSGMYNSGGYQWYGCNVQNCVIEAASIGTIYYAEAVNIKNNIIEGSPSRTCIDIANAYALNIEGNYFEANGTDISMLSITGIDRNIRIIGNFFANSSSSIVLPDTASAEYSSAIVIMNNKQIGNSPVLVKGQSNQEYIDVFCAFNSGNVTDLPTESLKVITSKYFWN